MGTFKITNITNFLGKRDNNSNTILDITYVDNMTKKTIKVKPNESIYLTTQSLPLSVHRLRVKNLITVSEVSEAELAGFQSTSKPKKSLPSKPKATKKTVAPEPKVEEDDDEKKYSASKRSKSTKKETEE